MPHVTRHEGPPLKVGLNAHLLSLTQTYRSAGINGYIYQLLNRLPGEAGAGWASQLICTIPGPSTAPGSKSSAREDTTNPWRRILWSRVYWLWPAGSRPVARPGICRSPASASDDCDCP
jgi:hypothetical protein